ncbi:MAG TPA: hypothetical protein VL463_10660 [Kofleriaceae bacterium]|nr:hypothetical protein [Kofleriaceae bacterium]
MAFGAGVRAGAAPHASAPASREIAGCPTAARVEVAVPAEVDEIRAIVDAPAPGAAAAVTIVSGRSDRELNVFGGGAWGLQLGSPLPAGRMVVAVDPVLDAPAHACIDHVELLRRGAVVARVVPR